MFRCYLFVDFVLLVSFLLQFCGTPFPSLCFPSFLSTSISVGPSVQKEYKPRMFFFCNKHDSQAQPSTRIRTALGCICHFLIQGQYQEYTFCWGGGGLVSTCGFLSLSSNGGDSVYEDSVGSPYVLLHPWPAI